MVLVLLTCQLNSEARLSERPLKRTDRHSLEYLILKALIRLPQAWKEAAETAEPVVTTIAWHKEPQELRPF